MLRSTARALLVVLAIVLAILAPLLASGYWELKRASTADSYTAAAAHYQNAAQRIPWRSDLYELAGDLYYNAKEYARAEASYRRAFERGALSPGGWVAWGDVLYLSGDVEHAIALWEQALEQGSSSPDLYSRLAEVYQSRGDLSAATTAMQEYVSAHPQDASAHYRLGLLLALSNPEAAQSQLESASTADPAFAPAAATLGAALDLALQNDSASRRYVIIGRGLGLVNEWKLARHAFESAIEADGKDAEAWAWVGEAKQQTGEPNAGLTELDRALALDASLPAVRGLRGLYFQRVGNFRQALAEFESAASLEPENPAWYVSLGEAHSKNGDLIRALEAYRIATVLAPEDPGYWRLLAIFCAQNNVNVKDVGVPAAQKALILTPEDPASLDVLGWLLTLDGRHEEAERMLTRALELDPDSASAHGHIGMLYLQLDERASAYDHLIRARDLGNQEAELVLKQYFP
jgi:tetratricopeptide (TPR) repeat protein